MLHPRPAPRFPDRSKHVGPDPCAGHPCPSDEQMLPLYNVGRLLKFSISLMADWGPVGMWMKPGKPVGNPCGQARGQAKPVHRLSISGCPRAEHSEPVFAQRSSIYPRVRGFLFAVCSLCAKGFDSSIGAWLSASMKILAVWQAHFACAVYGFLVGDFDWQKRRLVHFLNDTLFLLAGFEGFPKALVSRS